MANRTGTINLDMYADVRLRVGVLEFIYRAPLCLFCGLRDTCVAYYPARVGDVLGSERIYDGGLPLPSLTDGLFIVGRDSFEPATSGVRVR